MVVRTPLQSIDWNVTHGHRTTHGLQESVHGLSAVQGLGADDVLDYTQDTVDKVFKNSPFDAVIDMVGGRIERIVMKVKIVKPMAVTTSIRTCSANSCCIMYAASSSCTNRFAHGP